MNMKLEVVIVPVSDVDRAKAFYEKLGFRLDGDFVVNGKVPRRTIHSSTFRGVDHLRQGSRVTQAWLH
jgi:catechol 2,3-dioxygenase-like lactoylglutathione lyase family enzyme